MGEWLIGIALAALGIVSVALAVAVKKTLERLRETREQLTALEQRYAALQQQNQNDILAIGQRMLEADRLVRKFSARLDAIETSQFTDTQYGQLETLVSKGLAQQSEASSAEVELLSLLRRQQQRP